MLYKTGTNLMLKFKMRAGSTIIKFFFLLFQLFKQFLIT